MGSSTGSIVAVRSSSFEEDASEEVGHRALVQVSPLSLLSCHEHTVHAVQQSICHNGRMLETSLCA